MHDWFQFDNTFAAELDGLFLPWKGDVAPDPQILKLNRRLASELGLDPEELDSPAGAELFTGSRLPPGATPLAQAYAGHQFGGFSPRLGDGRALLIGEIVDPSGQRRDLHLKGSGATPFSRGGDGKAAVGPVLREYLVGEFMHAVGIPTTRSLAAATTGETIRREGPLPGAVLTRVASSHIRVGTFQYLAARGEAENLARLVSYVLARHFPDRLESENPPLELLRAVIERQASLVARWLSIGFVHGVMNTDNMTVSGETIDYGPCAFLDAYDPRAVFSSIDRSGRYAFGQQPAAAQWNLARFAEALLPLIDAADPEYAVELATRELEEFSALCDRHLDDARAMKLGLAREESDDAALIDDLFQVLEAENLDFTLLFRSLGGVLRGERPLDEENASLGGWLERWLSRQEREVGDRRERADALDRVNPLYIPRNHKVEEALQFATAGDFAPFEVLLSLLENPFVSVANREEFEKPAPMGFGPYVTYCGT